MTKDYLKSIDQTLKDILKELKLANKKDTHDIKSIAKEIAIYQEHARAINRR